MAFSDAIPVQLALPNARKVFVQNVTFTTSSASTQLSAATADGTKIPKGAMYVIQPDQDVYYDLTQAGRTLTATSAVRVLQYAQEYVMIGENDGGAPGNGAAQNQPFLSLIGATASGNCVVFVVLGSGV